MYHGGQYSHGITRSLFKDAEMQDPAQNIPSDRAKIKEPPDKIAIKVSVCASRMKKMRPPNVTT